MVVCSPISSARSASGISASSARVKASSRASEVARRSARKVSVSFMGSPGRARRSGPASFRQFTQAEMQSVYGVSLSAQPGGDGSTVQAQST